MRSPKGLAARGLPARQPMPDQFACRRTPGQDRRPHALHQLPLGQPLLCAGGDGRTPWIPLLLSQRCRWTVGQDRRPHRHQQQLHLALRCRWTGGLDRRPHRIQPQMRRRMPSEQCDGGLLLLSLTWQPDGSSQPVVWIMAPTACRVPGPVVPGHPVVWILMTTVALPVCLQAPRCRRTPGQHRRPHRHAQRQASQRGARSLSLGKTVMLKSKITPEMKSRTTTLTIASGLETLLPQLQQLARRILKFLLAILVLFLFALRCPRHTAGVDVRCPRHKPPGVSSRVG